MSQERTPRALATLQAVHAWMEGEQRELEKAPNQTMEKLKPRAHSPLENHSSIGEAERRTGERGGRRREVPTASWGRSFGKKAKGGGRGNTGEKGRCGVSGYLSITIPPPQKPTISSCQTLWVSQAAAPKARGHLNHCVSRESCSLAFTQEILEQEHRDPKPPSSSTVVDVFLSHLPPCYCHPTNLCPSWHQSSSQGGAQHCWQGPEESPGSAQHGESHGGLGRTSFSADTHSSPPAREKSRQFDLEQHMPIPCL